MNTTLVLFDVDGTLLLTGKAGMRAMHWVGSQLFGDRFTWDGVEEAGHLDPLILAEALENNGYDRNHTGHHEAFENSYLSQLQKELNANPEAVDALPGVHETLALLRQRREARGDVVLGLLTGNYTRAVPIKLGAVGIDPGWFEITAFGDEACTRADLVELAMNKYQTRYGQTIHPRRVIIIGDTPRDIACAKAHGCVAFAVATGRYSTEHLHETGADIVVKDMGDPKVLMAAIDQAPSAGDAQE